MAEKRILDLADVCEMILTISSAQAYALVTSGELPAIGAGRHGEWRVESPVLDEYGEMMAASLWPRCQ